MSRRLRVRDLVLAEQDDEAEASRDGRDVVAPVISGLDSRVDLIEMRHEAQMREIAEVRREIAAIARIDARDMAD